jgi:adenosylcobinamide-GDP ribazoletransferase
MIGRFFGALQFLTIVPVRFQTAPSGQSALFFPLVGAALGAAGGLLLEAGRGYLPFTLLALAVLAFWSLITGGLHEDAVADVADAFRAWRPPEKILEILKDSRIGAHGALALILLVAIRWQALASIAVDAVFGLAAALALGRAAVVALAWSTPPAGSATAAQFSRTLTTPVSLAAILQGIAFAFLPGAHTASFLLGGATVLLLLARRYFLRRVGGVNGDCLGATEQIIETWCLVVFTCRPCTL